MDIGKWMLAYYSAKWEFGLSEDHDCISKQLYAYLMGWLK